MKKELRFCIDYIKPNSPYRGDGKLNVRHFRTLSEEEAVNVITILRGCGCKFVDLYRGNVQDGKLIEWEPLPMIVNKEEDFYKEGEFDHYLHIKGHLGIALMHYLDNIRPEGKMCLSNSECFDIDMAFDERDWAKIERYIQKYISKTSEEQSCG